MNKKIIKFIQAQLNLRGLESGAEDGILGEQTLAALNQIEEIPKKWSKKRKGSRQPAQSAFPGL